MTVTVLIDT